METTQEVDELCECGHQKSEHGFSYYKGVPVGKGHGACTKCNCKKFTWVDYA